MPDYKIISSIGDELSILDYKELTKTIEEKFSDYLVQEEISSEDIMQEWWANGNSLFLYYKKDSIEVLIDEETKDDFESKTKLKLEEIQ